MPVGEYSKFIAAPRLEWVSDASCRGAGPQFFFRDERGPYTELGWENFCKGCRVRVDCLAHSFLEEEHWGVWGGFTPNSRKRLLSELLEGTVSWDHIAKALR